MGHEVFGNLSDGHRLAALHGILPDPLLLLTLPFGKGTSGFAPSQLSLLTPNGHQILLPPLLEALVGFEERFALRPGDQRGQLTLPPLRETGLLATNDFGLHLTPPLLSSLLSARLPLQAQAHQAVPQQQQPTNCRHQTQEQDYDDRLHASPLLEPDQAFRGKEGIDGVRTMTGIRRSPARWR